MPSLSWLASPLSHPSPSSQSPKQKKTRDRRVPKGLWKARARETLFAPRCQPNITTSSLSEALARLYHHDRDAWSDSYTDDSNDNELDHDHEESVETHSNSSSNSRKKRRLSTPDTTESDDAIYWDYSRQCSPGVSSQPPQRESSWKRQTRIMDTSSLTVKGEQMETKGTCDYEDWLDLKELFAKAVEQYERDDASEALPLIRGVIHECHRFLLFYQDPSVLFTNPNIAPTSPQTLTPPEERLSRDWTEAEHGAVGYNRTEHPTAFHAILGTALFLFGNLIAQDQSLTLQGEPDVPLPYWFAALDVFETGENLPSKTSGRGGDYPEDWRMAIVWGRTLVCIADEKINRERKANEEGSDNLPDPYLEESQWPPESPFAIIAKNRPPITRRMSLSTVSAHDLLKLAMDQFSRGIFHMPHPQHTRTSPQIKPQPPSTPLPLPTSSMPSTVSGNTRPPPIQLPPQSVHTQPPPPSDPLTSSTFSRAKELSTIASEVLLLADKLSLPSERQYWASWADSVFNQMKMELEGGGSTRVGVGGGVKLGSMEEWRRGIYRMRGQAMLIIGTARAEEYEEALEQLAEGGKEAQKALELLKGEDAEDAREALKEAISLFEKVKGMDEPSGSEGDHEGVDHDMDLEGESVEDEELKRMLTEALLTLANLTLDEEKREELYKRVEKEGGFDLKDEDWMEVDNL
ncbi:hypothetical protein D9758_000880 [Tetrapyrgos nigripes]|uniref:Uncharacterized protein n=1 Tax=Tetrapyrgos nigripes TaxID=182062 RepID=A0A8H5GZH8_9AGAR|nr:hypothetical protein D9758_000880 [Tetrapyrgos nigripes]